MKRIQRVITGVVGGLSLTVFTVVAAAPNGGPGAFYGMGGMGGMGMMHGNGPSAMAAQDLTQLKARLAITPQQEPAWTAFASKAAEQSALMQAMHAQHHQTAGDGTAMPDRMAAHIGIMTQHLAGMQAMNAAMRDLYGVLTPEQRRIADQQFGPRGQRGFGHGMHG